MNNNAEVKKIYLVFKTHLDLGYTALAEEILTRYREKLIPASLDVSEELRKRGGTERFSWTMGSWIINEYLTNGSAALRARMENGIRAGDLHWLGVPFTTHTELMDESLVQFGLSISRGLDRRFGRTTIAAKMTDVPGHTRSMLPHLAQAGIRFLHIGCNPGCTNPEVPDIFRWRSPDGSEILVMYHKKEYGEITVPPGLDFGIAFAHTSDNVGPQSAEAIIAIYEKLRAQFPNAVIAAGSLDAFAEALLPYAEQFPLITRELGDTWIHGPGSAPRRLDKMGEKVSQFEVIEHGNRRLHAIRDTVVYNGPEGRCEITPLDSPLVAPGKPELYDFSCKEPQMHHGVAFNLWNNMWNTNFTMWSEEDQRFRYRIRLESDARTALPDFDDWDRESSGRDRNKNMASMAEMDITLA